MKRIVVVLALTAVLAVLVGGSLVASPAPSEPVAAPKQAPPERPHEKTKQVFPIEFSILSCLTGETLHVTGELRTTDQVTYPPGGANSPDSIYHHRVFAQGTAVVYPEDPQEPPTEYRFRDNGFEITVAPSDPDYPYATYTTKIHWGVDSPGQGIEDINTFYVFHLSPNGVSNVTFHRTYECPSSASASATASPSAATTGATASPQ